MPFDWQLSAGARTYIPLQEQSQLVTGSSTPVGALSLRLSGAFPPCIVTDLGTIDCS